MPTPPEPSGTYRPTPADRLLHGLVSLILLGWGGHALVAQRLVALGRKGKPQLLLDGTPAALVGLAMLVAGAVMAARAAGLGVSTPVSEPPRLPRWQWGLLGLALAFLLAALALVWYGALVPR